MSRLIEAIENDQGEEVIRLIDQQGQDVGFSDEVGSFCFCFS